MPKRYTETLKWSDPWFRSLSPDAKLLWFWMVDNCDQAGIIDPDFALCEFQTGIKRAFEKLQELGDRIARIENGKLIIVKFIDFQQGRLSRDCKAHNPVFQSLEKNGMLDENGEIKGYPKGIDRVSIGYPYPTSNSNSNIKSKCTIKKEENEMPLPYCSDEFTSIWSDWERHLKEKKKPLSPTARKMQFAKLSEMGESRAVIALKYSMTNGWQGIYEPDKNKSSASTYAARHNDKEQIEIPDL